MPRRSLVVALLFALAGCADPTAAVSVKTTTKASSAPVAAKPSTEAPPLPVVGGAAGLISPGGATTVGPKLDPDTAGIATNPTQTLISNDGGGIKGSSAGGSANQPGAWTAQPAAGASTAPSPSPTPAR